MLAAPANMNPPALTAALTRCELECGRVPAHDPIGARRVAEPWRRPDPCPKLPAHVGEDDIPFQFNACLLHGIQSRQIAGAGGFHVNETVNPAVNDLGSIRIMGPTVDDGVVVNVSAEQERSAASRAGE